MVSIAVNWRLSTLTWVLTFALITADLALHALLKRLLVALAVRRLKKLGWVAHRPLAIARHVVAVATLFVGVAAEYFVLDSLTSDTACVGDAGGVCDTSLRVATYYTNPTEWERPVEPSYRPMMRLLERSGGFHVDRGMPWRVPADPDAVVTRTDPDYSTVIEEATTYPDDTVNTFDGDGCVNGSAFPWSWILPVAAGRARSNETYNKAGYSRESPACDGTPSRYRFYVSTGLDGDDAVDPLRGFVLMMTCGGNARTCTRVTFDKRAAKHAWSEHILAVAILADLDGHDVASPRGMATVARNADIASYMAAGRTASGDVEFPVERAVAGRLTVALMAALAAAIALAAAAVAWVTRGFSASRAADALSAAGALRLAVAQRQAVAAAGAAAAANGAPPDGGYAAADGDGGGGCDEPGQPPPRGTPGLAVERDAEGGYVVRPAAPAVGVHRMVLRQVGW